MVGGRGEHGFGQEGVKREKGGETRRGFMGGRGLRFLRDSNRRRRKRTKGALGSKKVLKGGSGRAKAGVGEVKGNEFEEGVERGVLQEATRKLSLQRLRATAPRLQ